MIRLTAGAALALALATALPATAQVVGGEAVRREDGRLALTWRTIGSGDPVDVFRERRGPAGIELILLSAADTDGEHVTTAESGGNVFVLRGPGSSGYRLAERLVALDGVQNFRDIGGYATADGRFVGWGRIFRSAQLSELTAGDLQRIEALRIRSVYDLRSTEEQASEPTAWTGPGAPARLTHAYSIDYAPFVAAFANGIDAAGARALMTGFYGQMSESHKVQFREVFAELLSPEDGAVLYHCTAGKDRTGVTTALILTALGVSREVVMADYLLSNTYYAPAAGLEASDTTDVFARMPADVQQVFMGVEAGFLDAFFAGIEARYGSVETYLTRELGVGPAELALLRTRYTV